MPNHVVVPHRVAVVAGAVDEVVAVVVAVAEVEVEEEVAAEAEVVVVEGVSDCTPKPYQYSNTNI